MDLVFRECILDFSAFNRLRMEATEFHSCSLKEVDFTEADLTGTLFEECNLEAALFDQSILEKADFRTAQNFKIDPRKNKVRNAVFHPHNLEGLVRGFGVKIMDR